VEAFETTEQAPDLVVLFVESTVVVGQGWAQLDLGGTSCLV
jgi:hypothetical protein